ncbi:hypothetical protein ACFSCX_17740 [Bacillus salitolerans]|uniref:Uncharacterized protein n=1 Tax=Bacillus salitolerans TaxID=1437434 RepID=A0ABW4LU99_9BACI
MHINDYEAKILYESRLSELQSQRNTSPVITNKKTKKKKTK